MRIYFCLFPLILVGCAHQPIQEKNQECYRWAAQGETTSLKAHWNSCQAANSTHATSLMMVASARDQIEVLEYLLSMGQDINETDLSGETALQYAAATDKTNAVIWLLNHGASQKSFRKDGISPLMITLMRGKRSTIDAFLAKPLDINAKMEDGWTLLFYATRREDLELLKKMLDLGADPTLRSKDNETALDLAREQEWKEGIATLGKASATRHRK